MCLSTYIHSGTCTYVYTYPTDHIVYVDLRRQHGELVSLLLPHGIQGLNSGCQLLPNKPSFWPQVGGY